MHGYVQPVQYDKFCYSENMMQQDVTILRASEH